MQATILRRPPTFDRVDRVKEVTGQPLCAGDDKLWILGGAMVVEIDSVSITIPRGFVTDGASVPSFAQWLTGWHPWDEPHRWGAILHDWLYCCPTVAKIYADLAFRETLRAAGATQFRSSVMYWAVRVGGWPAYFADQRQGPLIITR